MASLQEGGFSVCVIMLDHIILERFVSLWGLSRLPLPFDMPALVYPTSSLGIHRCLEPRVWELRAFKNIAKVSGAYHTVMLISLLKPWPSIMSLLHVELQVVFIFKMLIANTADLVFLGDFFMTEEFKLIFYHTEVAESALRAILNDLDAISGKKRIYLWLNFVNDVLRVSPRTIVILEFFAIYICFGGFRYY